MIKKMLKFMKDIFKGILHIGETKENFVEPVNNPISRSMVSNKTIEMIKKHEGYRTNAYEDVVGVWTIGYGNTFYEDGTKVKSGDKVTKARAEELLKHIVNDFATDVDKMVKVDLNPCQFGALVSFSYNVGLNALKRSTLLKKVNANPNDAGIALEFVKWTKAGGKTFPGLVKRRQEESDYYFSKNCK